MTVWQRENPRAGILAGVLDIGQALATSPSELGWFALAQPPQQISPFSVTLKDKINQPFGLGGSPKFGPSTHGIHWVWMALVGTTEFGLRTKRSVHSSVLVVPYQTEYGFGSA